ncbi:short-chain dehydrogenase [Fusarium beomiforme]|uniref:Short-chain dehydrogenase n=1 Tax=Fusarium beomiforme TaxID=44412 RepID=A0A9P5DM50_9HYPO|nr:short-chain dehydrogenase [Fusarium beomiforme]
MESRHLASYPALEATIKGIDLSGKSVLITGGGYGIGVDIARAFVDRRASEITLVGRTESKLKATAESFSLSGTKVTYIVTDISSEEDVQRLFVSLDKSPDFLINNAGYLPNPSLFVDGDLQEWWRGFTVNVYGTALVTQNYLRHRRGAAKASVTSPAVVITLNTIGAFAIRPPQLSAYGVSKAALARWNELVAADVPPSEARFISVHPGAVETDMAEKSGLKGVFPSTDGNLVGKFVTWLVSEDAAFLSGRFVWVNWDITELLKKKGEIVEKDLLITNLSQ